MGQRSGEQRPGRITAVARKSERELLVSRHFDAPPQMVFRAWTQPELFRRWWVPESFGLTLLSCEMDVRVGGGYRLVFALDDGGSMAFFGSYLEVAPGSRLVWTNAEEADAPVTTVTFAAEGGGTRLVLHELYPTGEALDAAMLGPVEGLPEQFAQLDGLLAETAQPNG